MFHAVGLKVIDARERKRDDLDVSTRALKDMIDRQTAHVVVENRPEDVADGSRNVQHSCQSIARFVTYIQHPLTPPAYHRACIDDILVRNVEQHCDINAYSTWYRVSYIHLHASKVMANLVCGPFNWRTLRVYVFRI